jgi:hypothetical protein
MDSLFSLIFFLLLPLGVGILTIYLSVDLLKYLEQYHDAHQIACRNFVITLPAVAFFKHKIKNGAFYLPVGNFLDRADGLT